MRGDSALRQILEDVGFVYNDRDEVEVKFADDGSELRGPGRVDIDPEPDEYLLEDTDGPNELRLVTDELSHQIEHARESNAERKQRLIEKYEDEGPILAGYVANVVEDAYVDKNRTDRFGGMDRTAAYSADKLMSNDEVLPDVSDMDREEQMVFGLIQIGIAGYVKGYEDCPQEVQEFFGFARQRIELARSAVDGKRRNALNDQIVQQFIETANDPGHAEEVISQNIDTLPTDPVPRLRGGEPNWQENEKFEELTDSEEPDENEGTELEYEQDPSGTEGIEIPEGMQQAMQREMQRMEQEGQGDQQPEPGSLPTWVKFLSAGIALGGMAFLAYGVMAGFIPLWVAALTVALLLFLLWLLSKLLSPPPMAGAAGAGGASASGSAGSDGNQSGSAGGGSGSDGEDSDGDEPGSDSDEGGSDSDGEDSDTAEDGSDADEPDSGAEGEDSGSATGSPELGEEPTDRSEQEEFGEEVEESSSTSTDMSTEEVGSVQEQIEDLERVEEEQEAAEEIARKAGDWFDVDDEEDYHEPDREAIERFETMQDMDTADMEAMLEHRDQSLEHQRGSNRIQESVARSGLEDEIVEAFRQLKTRDRDVPARRGKKINVRNSVRRLAGDTSEHRLYDRRKRAESGDRAMGVAVDMSGSMNLDKTRIALGSLKIATDVIGDDMVVHGFHTGSRGPTHEHTTNVSTPLLTGPTESVEWEHLDLVTSGGGTPTGAGISATRATLQRCSKPEKVMVVITDGHPNNTSARGDREDLSPADEALAEVRECRRKGIKVLAMGVGSIDQDLMNKIFGEDWVHTEEDTLAEDLVTIYRSQMNVA